MFCGASAALVRFFSQRADGPGSASAKAASLVLLAPRSRAFWKFAGTASVVDEVAAEVEFTAMMELPSEV